MRYATRQDVIAAALVFMLEDLEATGPLLDCKKEINDYLVLKLHKLEHEVFGMLLLDIRGNLIADKIVAQGTLTTSKVYPREVAKACLLDNCAYVVLYHNHPDGTALPSMSDFEITQNLIDTLEKLDVQVYDHIIVAGGAAFSMRKENLITD